MTGLKARAMEWASRARRRPGVNAAVGAVVAAMAAGWGLWSCQTTGPGVSPVGPTTVQEIPRTEPDVRVRIKAAVATVKLSGPEEFLVRAGVGQSKNLPGPLTITATEGGCRIGDGKGVSQTISGVASVEIEAVPKGSLSNAPERIRVDGVAYPGKMRVLARSTPVASGGAELSDLLDVSPAVTPVVGYQAERGTRQPGTRASSSAASAKMDLLEVVPIETYLSGVIVSEMPKQWPLGAFQVQAVCARTYALHERQRAIKAGRAWDLEAGEIDQAYNGGPEVPTAVRAVADTRGVVLTTDGHLLRAYYSSTCGGRTAGAATIWPIGPGFEFNLDKPIQANAREAACKDSPVYRWSVTRDRSDLSKQIREWGKVNSHVVAKMGLIRDVELDQANTVGRPTRYVITDDSGTTFQIAAELLRVACNYNTSGVKPVTKDTRVRSGDLEMEVTPSGVVVRGRGFGHGVGMCQYCAKAMAERGDNWQEMVARFYPGAKLERAY